MADQVLDAKGLNCPLPILKTKKALKGMTSGQILQVMATDPGSIADMTAFCNQTGNELMSQSNEGDVYTFEIKVS
jgi:tRNA 2-thiouridine synthesizing protein A